MSSEEGKRRLAWWVIAFLLLSGGLCAGGILWWTTWAEIRLDAGRVVRRPLRFESSRWPWADETLIPRSNGRHVAHIVLKQRWGVLPFSDGTWPTAEHTYDVAIVGSAANRTGIVYSEQFFSRRGDFDSVLTFDVSASASDLEIAGDAIDCLENHPFEISR
jgi:hypothetical protein